MTSSVCELVFLPTSASLEVPGRRHCFGAAYIKTTSSRPSGLDGVVNKNKQKKKKSSSMLFRSMSHCDEIPPHLNIFIVVFILRRAVCLVTVQRHLRSPLTASLSRLPRLSLLTTLLASQRVTDWEPTSRRRLSGSTCTCTPRESYRSL